MGWNLRVALFAIAIILFYFIIRFLRNGKMPFKYSLIWFAVDLSILVCAILPKALVLFTSMLGFQTISNLIIGVILVLLIIVCMSLTMIVSVQKKQLILLTQEVSILKKERITLKKGK